jgi:hypothetical protein
MTKVSSFRSIFKASARMNSLERFLSFWWLGFNSNVHVQCLWSLASCCPLKHLVIKLFLAIFVSLTHSYSSKYSKANLLVKHLFTQNFRIRGSKEKCPIGDTIYYSVFGVQYSPAQLLNLNMLDFITSKRQVQHGLQVEHSKAPHAILKGPPHARYQKRVSADFVLQYSWWAKTLIWRGSVETKKKKIKERSRTQEIKRTIKRLITDERDSL